MPGMLWSRRFLSITHSLLIFGQVLRTAHTFEKCFVISPRIVLGESHRARNWISGGATTQ